MVGCCLCVLLSTSIHMVTFLVDRTGPDFTLDLEASESRGFDDVYVD